MNTDNLIKVSGHPGLARDPSTGAILNTNVSEMERARQRKEFKIQSELEKQKLIDDVEGLKEDIKEIKRLIKSIAGD